MIKNNRNNEQIYGRNDMIMLDQNNKIYGSLGLADKYVMRTEEGTILVLNNPKQGRFGDVLTEFNMYGRSEQFSTTGAQLFNENIEIKNRGVTIKINGSTVTFKGTVSDESSSRVNFQKKIILKPGKYTASSSNKKIFADFSVKKANDETIYSSHIEIDGTEEEVRVRVLFGERPSAKGDVINGTTNIMVNEGDIALPYEPYTGGKPSPSPEYPVEIKSVVNPAIKICGKNLFDSKKFPIILNRAINTRTGNVYVSSSGNYCAIEKYIPFPYSGKKISFNASMSLCAYDKDYKFISTVNKNNGQVPTGTMYVRFDIKTKEKDKAQIELSENATTYEPYKEQTIQLPITLNAIPVSSGGNVTINGQQYVADYVDVERGKVVRCVKREPLSKNGRLSSSSVPFYTYNLPSAKPKTITEVFALCNLAQFNSIMTSNSQIGISSDGSNSLRMRLDGYATLEQYTRLSAEIIYELATPIEEDLTSEQITAFKELVTYYPVTIVENNYNTWMKATYKSMESV